MADSKIERGWARLRFVVLAAFWAVCTLQAPSAKAQDVPEQEQGPPPLPPPGDPEAGFVEPPPREKKPQSRRRRPSRRKRGAAESSARQGRGRAEAQTRDEGGEAPGSGGRRREKAGSFSAHSTYPDSGQRGGQQTQVLGRGVLRIEGGPADFTLRDSGFLGEGRGMRLGRADHGSSADPYAGLGLGVSFGAMENLEVGILELPVIFADGYGNADFGNIELHGRVGVVKSGPVEFGAQLVVQLPSNRAFGVAFGLPLRVLATEALIIDFGVETEIVTYIHEGEGSQTIANLDVPVAINYYVTPRAFVGVRSGLFVLDFEEVFVPLGVQGGYGFLDGMVELMGWFQWAAISLGQNRYNTDGAFDAGSFEFGVGANVFLGFPRGG